MIIQLTKPPTFCRWLYETRSVNYLTFEHPVAALDVHGSPASKPKPNSKNQAAEQK